MVTEVEVTVKVTKVGIRLVKVVHGRGYQLVCGGRLVTETTDGVKTPHPDLPEYVPDMFPGGWDAWERTLGDSRVADPDVRIEVQRDGNRFVPCNSPRASAYLFGIHPKDEVLAWIRKEAR